MRRLLVLLILLTVGGAAAAQKAWVGLKAGGHFSQLNGMSWEPGYRSNLVGGVYAGASVFKLGVQIEALLQQSTYRTGKTSCDFYTNYYQDLRDSARAGTFRVSAYSIPVLLQFRPVKYFWMEAGPQFSGLLDVEDKEQLLRNPGALFAAESYEGVVGIGLRLSRHLNISGRYLMGFTNLNATSEVREKWQQRTVQVFLGYQF